MSFLDHIGTTLLIVTYFTGVSLESQCVCSINGSLPVYSQPQLSSTVIGTIPAKDCKPYVYPVDGNFTAILINKQLGFVSISVDQINVISNCTGNNWQSQTSQHPAKSDIASTTTGSTPVQTSMTTLLKPQPSCPNGWIMHGYSCYLFHTNSRRHWSDANRDCVSSASHLVIIETADEFIFLKSQLDLRIDTHYQDSSDTSVWGAGRDNRYEGHWEWYDGFTNTYKPFTYTHWGHDEPDAGEGEHEEDCLAMVGNKGFIWADISCNENLFYVCEQSAV
ncbi:C-type lectin domain family 7 member A-like isoform X2 [Mercenaria mercenaria]|uniref:C-type lectin domain family 7 member A-like isoform X2 n=1 Tax=Mercenaria mercenaria TaxID=6596 RepID=UPI00234E4ABB|nr:C-type lectin domain family 7 member A-like isoform X2 [Mercenaria mercenaria]